MKNLSQVILKDSDNETINLIFKELSSYKIIWKVKSIDSAIKDVTNEKWISNYCEDTLIKKYDKVFVAKCWNEGTSLSKDSKYNQATIVSSNNNTEVIWFFFVKKNKCDMYYYEKKYYGQESVLKKLLSFSL